MALSCTFKKETMDVIMYVSRKFSCNVSEAIDFIIENKDLIEEAKCVKVQVQPRQKVR